MGSDKVGAKVETCALMGGVSRKRLVASIDYFDIQHNNCKITKFRPLIYFLIIKKAKNGEIKRNFARPTLTVSTLWRAVI